MNSFETLCILPVFNGEGVVSKAIDSIINQSYKDWHLVVINDASTDNTFITLNKYKKHPQITILTNRVNKGVFYSINRGLFTFKQHSWKYFTVHGADDTSSNDRFFTYINTFNQNFKLSAIIGVSNGKRWDTSVDPPEIKYHKFEHATGINFYKKEVFDTLGYFYNTRFAGDAEYIDRFMYYLVCTCPSYIDPLDYKNSVVQSLPPKYGYTYTTSFHKNSPSLTKKYTSFQREEFKTSYQKEHKNYSSPKHFFKFFIPDFEDRNLPKKNITPKILVATPMWRRFDLTKSFIKHHQKLGLDILIVGSEGDRSRTLCEDLGCFYIEHPNSPIGAKFNKRIDFFLDNEQYTHLLLLGSDDFIDQSTLNLINYYLQYVEVISWKDIYFHSPKYSMTIYSPGYTKGHYRYGEPLAPGRCISRNVIKNYFKGTLWEDNVQTSPDGGLWDKLRHFDNQVILSCKENKNIIVDIKTSENLTSFSRLVDTYKDKYINVSYLSNKINSWIQ